MWITFEELLPFLRLGASPSAPRAAAQPVPVLAHPAHPARRLAVAHGGACAAPEDLR